MRKINDSEKKKSWAKRTIKKTKKNMAISEGKTLEDFEVFNDISIQFSLLLFNFDSYSIHILLILISN